MCRFASDSDRGKGVIVCEEWRNNYILFYKWAIENGYDENNKKDSQIDRIDSNGDYCPSNCRIVDRYIQATNKSNNHREMVNGEYLTLPEAHRKYSSLPFKTVSSRVYSGWSFEDAVMIPSMKENHYKDRGKYKCKII